MKRKETINVEDAMRKILMLLILLLLPTFALAEELSVTAPREAVRPGKAYLISFETPEAGNVNLTLADEQDNRRAVIMLDYPANAGLNQLWWNGTYEGVPAPEGEWRLLLTMANGKTAEAPVTVGDEAPYLTAISLSATELTPDAPLTISYYASCEGRVTCGVWMGAEWRQVASWPVTAGEGSATWDGAGFYDGRYTLTLLLTDAAGSTSNEEHAAVTLAGFGAKKPATATAVPGETAAPIIEDEDEVLLEDETEPEVTAAPVLVEEEDEVLLEDETEPEVTAAPVLVEEEDEVLLEDETEPEVTAAPVLVEEEDEVLLEDGTEPEVTAVPVLIEEEDEVLLEDDEEPSTLVAAGGTFTPAFGSPYAGMDTSANFWTTPMDITDEDAVWAMLTAPITVVDNGAKSSEKVQVYLRARPDDSAEPVGVVTCETQGVHVLASYDNGWSLVECYSSSFHDTKVEAWNMLVQGYIKTSWLKEVKPNQNMGFVIDKLTQRLYVFKDGRLYATLLVSTGLSNKRQPYNETRSGEFITASKVGEFKSDNLACAMAIRFNSGDLLHEVPHIKNSDGTKNFSGTEKKLGTRASHGCVRVQRKKTPEGVNMTWIWNATKGSSKIRIVIWEDWQGRQIPIPDDDFQLYYNSKGGKYYHSQKTCYMAQNRTFEPFSYGQLETDEFKALKRCEYCAPALRVAEIEEINAAHALGGDHDPVLTAARQAFIKQRLTYDTDLIFE